MKPVLVGGSISEYGLDLRTLAEITQKANTSMAEITQKANTSMDMIPLKALLLRVGQGNVPAIELPDGRIIVSGSRVFSSRAVLEACYPGIRMKESPAHIQQLINTVKTPEEVEPSKTPLW